MHGLRACPAGNPIRRRRGAYASRRTPRSAILLTTHSLGNKLLEVQAGHFHVLPAPAIRTQLYF